MITGLVCQCPEPLQQQNPHSSPHRSKQTHTTQARQRIRAADLVGPVSPRCFIPSARIVPTKSEPCGCPSPPPPAELPGMAGVEVDSSPGEGHSLSVSPPLLPARSPPLPGPSLVESMLSMSNGTRESMDNHSSSPYRVSQVE